MRTGYTGFKCKCLEHRTLKYPLLPILSINTDRASVCAQPIQAQEMFIVVAH
jgi:hypothetical protein